MNSILNIVVVATLAYLGTMVDNFFAFSAQLLLTEARKFKRVSWAQALGVASLVALASALGSLLHAIPIEVVGVLSIVPFSFGLYTWRHRHDEHQQYRRGALTTFLMTIALGGDNLAVWTPLFRAHGILESFGVVITFGVLEVIFIFGARQLATHPRIVGWGTQHRALVMPYIYVALGVLILVECRIF